MQTIYWLEKQLQPTTSYFPESEREKCYSWGNKDNARQEIHELHCQGIQALQGNQLVKTISRNLHVLPYSALTLAFAVVLVVTMMMIILVILLIVILHHFEY